MEEGIPDQMCPAYRVRPGVIDVNHLELVALVKVARGSWMPHFRQIAGNGVWIPQRRDQNGASFLLRDVQNSVPFVRQDGSYLPVTAALEGDYTGLVNRDLPALDDGIYTVALQLQVN